jgi:hypothetical protein
LYGGGPKFIQRSKEINVLGGVAPTTDSFVLTLFLSGRRLTKDGQANPPGKGNPPPLPPTEIGDWRRVYFITGSGLRKEDLGKKKGKEVEKGRRRKRKGQTGDQGQAQIRQVR